MLIVKVMNAHIRALSCSSTSFFELLKESFQNLSIPAVKSCDRNSLTLCQVRWIVMVFSSLSSFKDQMRFVFLSFLPQLQRVPSEMN
eukprot:756964-Hanusia_phi.AAC.4